MLEMRKDVLLSYRDFSPSCLVVFESVVDERADYCVLISNHRLEMEYLPVSQITQPITRNQGHPVPLINGTIYHIFYSRTIICFDGVGIGRNACNLLKGVFRGKSLGPLVRSDLLAPRFLQNEWPKLNAFDYPQVDETVIVCRHAIVDDDPMLLAIAEEFRTVGSIGVSLRSLDQSW